MPDTAAPGENSGPLVVLLPIHDRDGILLAHAILDVEDGHLAKYNWSFSANGRGRRYVRRRGPGGKMIKLHREILGLEHGNPLVGDHIDGDPLNNRRSNLRAITRGGNIQNRHAQQGRSKLRGVCWDAARRKWRAVATVNYHQHDLGRFDSEEEAGRVAASFRAEHMPFSTG